MHEEDGFEQILQLGIHWRHSVAVEAFPVIHSVQPLLFVKYPVEQVVHEVAGLLHVSQWDIHSTHSAVVDGFPVEHSVQV